jgi:formate hydrogenlyase subunit 3/multisubunit Na+/H+ antiporter MnhD subunit
MLVLIGGSMEYELALWLLTLHIGGKLLFYFVMMAKDELEITRDMRQSEGLLKNYPLLSASSLFGAVFLIPLAPFTGLILFEPILESFSGKFWLLGLLLAISIFLIIGHLIRLVRGNLWGSKHKEFALKKKYPKTIKIAIYIDIVMLILLTFIIFLSPKFINWFI